MDEIIPGLWIGDLASALDVENLRKNGIYSVLTAMRGKIAVHETFVRHQAILDDSEDADILIHFQPSITFIQTELDKGRGVLVHCLAGMSRSVSIVAAYLMYTKGITPDEALDVIRKSRPIADPNSGFIRQLEVFHAASFRVSQRDQTTRRFYMERTLEEVMNGDGSLPDTNMFANFPRAPSDSATASLSGPRRRIRCKKCRQELAAREHMLDHGQIGPETPPITTPVLSRCLSVTGENVQSNKPLTSGGDVSSLGIDSSAGYGAIADSEIQNLSLSSSAVDDGEEGQGPNSRVLSASSTTVQRNPITDFTSDSTDAESSVDSAQRLGHKMSDAIFAGSTAKGTIPEPLPITTTATNSLATLRKGPPAPSPASGRSKPMSAPILVNPKCSGYFLEPMKWMEPFLQSGNLAGKIICPNKKCGAKLGNFDWAGVCCGCKEWVTPGFCISRSKVDEITT